MPNPLHTFTLTERQALAVNALTADHLAALKNWIVTAVECGDLDRARKLAGQVRDHQALFALFNLAARRDVAEATGTPMPTTHGPRGE